jgi:hypothetical protein
MRARLSWLLTRRGLWLALGGPVAAFAAVLSVASVSLSPPGIKHRTLAYYRASTQVYVMPQGALGSSLLKSSPTVFTGQSITLANIMSSPELRNIVARDARLDPGQLAVDAPIPSYLPIAEQEPPGGKRATQIVEEGDPYRLTVDINLSLPAIGLTAQAPSPEVAQRIVRAAQTGLSTYLTSLEASAGTAASLRLQVRSLGPISFDSDDSGGLANVAGFTFIVTLALWSGLVVTAFGVARNLRAELRARAESVQVLNASHVGSETGDVADAGRSRSPRRMTGRRHATAIEFVEGARRPWN